MTGTIKNILDNEITLVINERESILSIAELKDNKLNIDIKKWFKKRSLDANAYMWVLANKIAEKLNVTSLEIYKDAIKNVGEFEILPIKNEAVETFLKGWEHNGKGWVVENLGKSKLEGYTNLQVFYGSSIYSSKSMARLINLIVEEAEQLGVETKTQAEIKSMLESWNNK